MMKKGIFLLLMTLLTGTYVSAQRVYDIYFLEAMAERQKGNHDASFNLLTRCQELNPQASETYFFLAQYYMEMKEQDKALDYFIRASQLEPSNATYMETLAQAYVGKERYSDAIEVLERLYESDKSRQELLEMLYKLHIHQHDYDKAISILNRMELIDGKGERLSLMKSSLYMQQGNKEASIKEMKALSEQHPNDLNYRTIYANTLMLGSSDSLAEQRKQALKILQEVLAEEPGNIGAQAAMRTYYIYENDTLRLDSITRCILLNPETTLDTKVSILRQEIGQSESEGGDSTRVLALFREMLALPEPSADIAEFCAAYMNMKKMPRDSVSNMLRMVLRLAPDNASARLQLVQYAWEDDDNATVVALCKDARLYNPDEMAFYYYQGMAFYRKDDVDNALDAFQNGISVITEQSNPAIVSDFYAVMGDLLHQKGRQREAFAAYDSCLQWKPDNVGCLNNYAYYLSELGQQLDKAERMSRIAITTEPKNATYLDTFAWILFMQGRYDEALPYINQALANDSTDNAVLIEHAGDIHAMLGHTGEAVALWQKALIGAPDNKALRKKIKRKKYIR